LGNAFKSTALDKKYWEKIVHDIDPNGDGKVLLYSINVFKLTHLIKLDFIEGISTNHGRILQ